MRKTILAALLLMTGIVPAVAIDFKTPIRALDGTPLAASEKDATPVTLGQVAETALITPPPGEQLSAEEKTRRYAIAVKIHAGRDPLTVEEIATVKRAVGQLYGPLVVGRAWEMLDPATSPTKEGPR